MILDRAHELAQLRPVEFIGAVPHAKASEFHVKCIRLKVRANRDRAAKAAETVRMSEITSRRRWPPRTLMDRIQHDYRYLALGLELIVGVGRPKFERLFPKSEAFLAFSCPGPRVHLIGRDLYFNVGVRKNIAIPPWML